MENNVISADRGKLVTDVIALILSSVNLQHIDAKTVSEQTPLMGGGLDLDSVDVLEVVVAVEHKFGVKIKDVEDGRHIFRTIGTITDFVQSHSKATH